MTQLFGRRWKLVISSPASAAQQTTLTFDSENYAQSLRLTFDVQTFWFQTYWSANIQIWNANEQITNFLLTQGNTANATPAALAGGTVGPLQQGMPVELSAGYENQGQFGVIWSGFVLQPMFDRVNQTDFVITLHCIIGLDELSRNSLGKVYPAGLTQLAIVKQMAQTCFKPIDVGYLDPNLDTVTFNRPRAMFGSPRGYFRDMARTNNMQVWLGQHGLLNMGGLAAKLNDQPKYTFSGDPNDNVDGLVVGTPQQTQFGVNCRLLLNPNVIVSNPPIAIRLNNTVISQLEKNPGDPLSAASVLSQSGTYAVVGARYVGDTRGNNWYTDVTGWLLAAERLGALEAATGIQIQTS